MFDWPTIPGIITNSLRTVSHNHSGYHRIKNDIIESLAKLPLEPARYLSNKADRYYFTVDVHRCGISNELLLKTLTKETWLQPVLNSGDLTLGFTSNGSLKLCFKLAYIDGLIKAGEEEVERLEKLAAEKDVEKSGGNAEMTKDLLGQVNDFNEVNQEVADGDKSEELNDCAVIARY